MPKTGAAMSSIDPMTSKSKPFLPEVTNQSNMNKRPGVIQSTYCMNPPTNLPWTHDRHAHFFSVKIL